MDFYHRSNTHDPDQDRFEDLYCRDFIHAISRVACHKLSRHHLDPYQHTAFRWGIVHYNTGKEEANPTLELAMEYASALGTIVFDESCRLRDLTERQIGRNQHATDLELERLDGEADHAAERIGALEDKEANMELSGPLYPNAPSVLFCTFPRPASPTSSTYPVGCPSPT